jgi:lysophospholipase L1-like esterase
LLPGFIPSSHFLSHRHKGQPNNVTIPHLWVNFAALSETLITIIHPTTFNHLSMKKINQIKTLWPLLAFMLLFQTGRPMPADADNNKTIVVLGSSVATGWVTSYREKYDMQNGYAARLSRLLEPCGWTVKNISLPGFDTRNTIARFEKDVVPLHPRVVLIGLSMANEGLTTDDPDSVFSRYKDGIARLIDLCRQHKIIPVIGLCYSNNEYNKTHYDYLKRINLLIQGWDVPCVNLLGAIDDGHGHFPEVHTFDPGHPDNRGHEELFLAFVPTLFDALVEPAPSFTPDTGVAGMKLSSGGPFHEVSYIPGEVMHPFSFGFSFKAGQPGSLGKVMLPGSQASGEIMINAEGFLVYRNNDRQITSLSRPSENQWHSVMITHGYLVGMTTLYLDGGRQGSGEERLEPAGFVIGNSSAPVAFRDLRIYRTALNRDEVQALTEGKRIEGSLEVWAPLMDATPAKNLALQNRALSTCRAVLDATENGERLLALETRRAEATEARTNELKVEHKKAISIDAALLETYAGQYEIAPGDFFQVEKKEGKLYFTDRGNSAELLPEAPAKFFIRYPADLSVTFETDANGVVTGLIFSMNGREMQAKRR